MGLSDEAHPAHLSPCHHRPPVLHADCRATKLAHGRRYSQQFQLLRFVPTHEIREPFLATSLADKNRTRGIGACLGLRRSVWLRTQGFDEMIGCSARFLACEEGDFAIRALQAGYYVYEAPRAGVVHSGFRGSEEDRELARRNWYGIGATPVKHLKCRQWAILPVIGYEGGVVACGELVRNTLRHRRPSGLTPIIAFASGFLAGAATPVDDQSRHYRSVRAG